MSWNQVWTILDRMAIVLMMIASGTVLWAIVSARTERSEAPSMPAAQSAEVEGLLSKSVTERRSAKGNPSAKLVVAEFSDYQCPYCARHAKDVLPTIEREFVETGKVRYLFMNFPIAQIHPHAGTAAQAAECAGAQGKYWEMHDNLFRNQKAIPQQPFIDLAKSLGLEMASFTGCLEQYSERIWVNDQELGKRFGIRSTPSFLLGELQRDGSVKVRRKLSGLLPITDFKEVLTRMMN